MANGKPTRPKSGREYHVLEPQDQPSAAVLAGLANAMLETTQDDALKIALASLIGVLGGVAMRPGDVFVRLDTTHAQNAEHAMRKVYRECYADVAGRVGDLVAVPTANWSREPCAVNHDISVSVGGKA